MTTVLGVDARRPDAWVTVELSEGSLASIARHDSLEAVLASAEDAHTVAFDVPIGHEDRQGSQRDGRRGADVAARDSMGEAADRVFWTPPLQVFEHDSYASARRQAEEEGWPVPREPMFAGRARLQAVNEAAAHDDRIVEIHPEVSYLALNEEHGGTGPLATHGRGPRATYERLQLLAQAGLRPTRSLGGVGRMNPRDVLEATVAAWSAHRVANSQARRLPEDPPTDPRTGRRVCIHA